VFESPVEDLKKAAALHKPRFALASDASGRIYDDFGLDHSLGGLLVTPAKRFAEMTTALTQGLMPKRLFDTSMTRMPADFVIGEDLRILLAYYGKDAGDHVGFDAIEALRPVPASC
jgi:thioredoxin-dependent peroxiredoxin